MLDLGGDLVELPMEWNVIPAEYDMPDQRQSQRRVRWIVGLAAIALLIGAGLALVTGSEPDSPVNVPTSE